MSGLSFSEYMETYTEDFSMGDPLMLVRKELEDMNVPENLNYENPGLMSSDFFDSVLSMEQCNFDENQFDTGLISNLDIDCGLSSDGDDLRLVNNVSPDSAGSHTSYELNDFILLNNNNAVDYKTRNDLMQTLLKQPETNVKKTATHQPPSKLYVNNTNSKKVIVTKPCAAKNKRAINNTKQVFRVQSISGKGRSLLLPFNVTKMKNIKIVNGNELHAENVKITKVAEVNSKKLEERYEISSPDTYDDDSDSVEVKTEHERQYPLLVLSEEEKRLLNKEGITLPTHYPLTKTEERELKRIRRKIRNKISAQDSRKRKKEYVDGLEQRIKQSAEEKKVLLNRVKHLQQQNNKLVAQMNKLQALVFNSNGSKATPTTCLLIVLASILLVSLPNMRLQKNSELNTKHVTAGRALLSSQQATNEDTLNLEEFLLFNKEDDSDIKNVDEDNNTEEYTNTKYMINSKFDNGDTNFLNNMINSKFDNGDANFLNNMINSKFDNGDPNFLNNPEHPLLDPTKIESDIRNTFNKVKRLLEHEFKDLHDVNTESLFTGSKHFEPNIDDVELNLDDEYLSAKRRRYSDSDQNSVYGHQVKSSSTVVSTTVSINSSRKE